MKIAALTDIHGNIQALKTVAAHIAKWEPDLVFVVGDTINRGPRSKACLQYVLQKQNTEGWKVIRGNHEDYVLDFEKPETLTSGRRFEMLQCTHWNYHQLTPHEIANIKTLPYQIEQTVLNGQTIRTVHGSMLGIREGIYPDTPQEELRDMVSPAPQILIVGHTHKALVRTWGETLVVNAGSVGLPFDGDTRPSYAQIRWESTRWEADIVRVNYDQAAAIRDFHTSGFLAEGGGMSKIILRELELARSLISPWLKRYKDAVIEGEIDVETGVREFLEEVGR